MFCTTECWNCEYKTCKHYISKQELYFENIKLKEKLEQANAVIDTHSELIDKLTEEKELYKGNYNTCLKALDEYDKDLKEYLESRNEKLKEVK